MNRSYSIIIFFISSLILTQFVSAQKIQLRYFDETTGFKVLPDSIIITPESGPSITKNYNGNEHGFSRETAINLITGRYKLAVFTTGYKKMQTDFVLGNDDTKIDFHLVSKQPVATNNIEFISSLHSPSGMVITGYISDELTGMPIENVKVFSTNGRANSTTDKNGFFKMMLPLVTEGETAPLLSFQKNNYKNELRKNFDIYPYGDLTLKIKMQKGAGENTADVVLNRPASIMDFDKNLQYQKLVLPESKITEQNLLTPDCVTSVKVGKTCSCHTCTAGFDVLDFNTYTANVLTSEWGQWGAWPNGMNSLNAGAVAIRSYAYNRIYFPLAVHGGNYNICNTTCCHVYNPAANPTSYAVAAIANTNNFILLTASGSVAQSEFAAETNDNCSPVQTSGNYCGQCGDGKFQKSVTGPPINSGGCYPVVGIDSVCVGKANQGHPRGMCQRGSVRWATGLTVPNNTTQGTTNGYALKNWQQLLNYYYPYYSLALCNSIVATPPDAFTLSASAACNGNRPYIKLSWTNATNANGYDLYKNNALYKTGLSVNQYADSIVSPGSTYSYVVKANNSAGSTVNVNGTITPSAFNCGIDSADLYQLKVYPNPAGDHVFLSAKQMLNSVLSTQLINAAGAVLKTNEVKISTGDYLQKIDLKNYAAGIYVFKVMINGKIYIKKIVKK
jgi:hypothetical protein